MSARKQNQVRLGRQIRWALLRTDLEQQFLDRLRKRWDKLSWGSLPLREQIIREVRIMPRYEGLTRG